MSTPAQIPRRANRSVVRARALALCIGIVAAAGCGGSDSSGPAALTSAQYQANLDVAAGRLQQAMRGIKTAHTTRGLRSRLAGAASQLRATSANLRRLSPPKPVAATHAQLVDALDDLAGEASLNDEVCGGASALTELSRTDAAGRVRSTSRALAQLGYRTRRLSVRRRRQADRTLPSGTIVSRSGSGSGGLTVSNGGTSDAVLKLATSRRRTILGMYVRAGSVASASGIPAGSFRVLFASGRDWDRARRGFTRDCEFTRFEGQVQYRPGTTYTLSLTPTAGGNASTQSIDETEFEGR